MISFCFFWKKRKRYEYPCKANLHDSRHSNKEVSSPTRILSATAWVKLTACQVFLLPCDYIKPSSRILQIKNL